MLFILVVTLISFSGNLAQEEFFKERPKNQSVLLGSDVLLRCSAYPSYARTGQVTSQWRDGDGVLLGLRGAGKVPGHEGRYSYVQNDPYENHLRIEGVTLEDNGQFECQMTLADGVSEPQSSRADAHITVLVPPKEVILLGPHRPGSVLEVRENSLLNVTCGAIAAKPATVLEWYENGQLLRDGVEKGGKQNSNKTWNSYASLLWKPNRKDHHTVLTCDSFHEGTSVRHNVNISLNVIHSSELPKVRVKEGSSVKAGDNVTLECVVKGGNPLPDVIWYLRDRPIGNDFYYDASTQITKNEYSMIVGPEDNAADYECRSSNSFSDEPVRKKLNLEVKYAPINVAIVNNATVRYGQFVSVRCVSGLAYPMARIEWLLNGRSVYSGESSNRDRNGGTVTESEIKVNTAEEDSQRREMTVECIAKNSVGSAKNHSIIKVLSPPTEPVILGMDGLAPLEGEILNLTCEARGGNPPPTLSWHKSHEKLRETDKWASGDAVSSSTSLKLERNMNLQQISCEAENGALDTPLSTVKTIRVFFPPQSVNVRALQPGQITAGVKNTLSCVSRFSNPEAEIYWLFSGTEKPLDARNYSQIAKAFHENDGFIVNNTLEFIPTAQMNGINVTCLASSPKWNEQKSFVFPLKVLYAPRILNPGSSEIVEREGHAFRTNFSVDAHPLASVFKWKKNGELFTHTVGTMVAKSATLSSHGLIASDSGIYELSVINAVAATNHSFRLVVEYPARVVRISDDVVVPSGKKVLLSCEAEGIPRFPGMVKWMRDDAVVKHGAINVDDGHTNLTFSASDETGGTYVCVANNSIGIPHRLERRVLVHTRPRIFKEPRYLRAAGPISGRTRLRCRARAVPNASFQWYLDGSSKEIQNSSQYSINVDEGTFPDYESTLWINRIEKLHYEREFRCVVKNTLGEDSVDIQVGPPSAPDVPRSVKFLNRTQGSVSVGWSLGFDGGSQQTFEVRYRGVEEKSYRSINTTEPELVIRGLKSGKSYEVSVRSWNANGFFSEYSAPFGTYTLDENGRDMYSTQKQEDSFPPLMLILFGIGGLLLVICNACLYCVMVRRHRRKKIMQEKTEMVRKMPNGKGDTRAVQMYGALVSSENACRPESANTNRSELGYERASEDDQSLRTIIEVNPNGFVEEINSNGYYDRDCIVEYDLDPTLYPDMIRPGSLRRPIPTYAPFSYTEPLGEEMSLGASSTSYSPGIVSRRSADAPLLGSPRRPYCQRMNEPPPSRIPNLQGFNNNGALMSTFVKSQPNSLMTTPLSYANVDGDLV